MPYSKNSEQLLQVSLLNRLNTYLSPSELNHASKNTLPSDATKDGTYIKDSISTLSTSIGEKFQVKDATSSATFLPRPAEGTILQNSSISNRGDDILPSRKNCDKFLSPEYQPPQPEDLLRKLFGFPNSDKRNSCPCIYSSEEEELFIRRSASSKRAAGSNKSVKQFTLLNSPTNLSQSQSKNKPLNHASTSYHSPTKEAQLASTTINHTPTKQSSAQAMNGTPRNHRRVDTVLEEYQLVKHNKLNEQRASCSLNKETTRYESQNDIKLVCETDSNIIEIQNQTGSRIGDVINTVDVQPVLSNAQSCRRLENKMEEKITEYTPLLIANVQSPNLSAENKQCNADPETLV